MTMATQQDIKPKFDFCIINAIPHDHTCETFVVIPYSLFDSCQI